MAVEYSLDEIDLCVYKVNSEIPLINGKYSFRQLDPCKFFVDNSLVLNVNIDPTSKCNASHYDNNAIPIFPGSRKCNFDASLGEIFVSSTKLNNIQFLRKDTFNYDTIRQILFG